MLIIGEITCYCHTKLKSSVEFLPFRSSGRIAYDWPDQATMTWQITDLWNRDKIRIYEKCRDDPIDDSLRGFAPVSHIYCYQSHFQLIFIYLVPWYGWDPNNTHTIHCHISSILVRWKSKSMSRLICCLTLRKSQSKTKTSIDCTSSLQQFYHWYQQFVLSLVFVQEHLYPILYLIYRWLKLFRLL